ncbi:MAG TPA: TldD/PmbA family protein [Candidatus Polarisedimenticolia bacterium]|nr:TldD/PmbA family protein [Candidatus Polarisedimenticolia bacterium]
MREAALALVERALAAGAAQAEAFVKVGATRTVRLEAGGGVSWTRRSEGGIALRLFTPEGGAGFAAACGPEPAEPAARSLVQAALHGALPDDAARLPLPGGPAPDARGFGIFDPRLQACAPSDLEGLLDEAASEALRAEPRVRRLDTASLAASSAEVWLANSSGFAGTYKQTLVHIVLGVVAGDGASSVVVRRSRTARSFAAFSPALFGDETARLAATALEGRAAPEGSYPAMLAPAAAAEVLRRFARSITPAWPDPSRPAGSACVTLIDDGRLPGGVASAPFDGEGVPTRRTALVERGAAGRTIHDRRSAAADGGVSTGNASRASFRDPPRRAPSNLFIAPGSAEPGELLAEMRGTGSGLWIQSLRPASSMMPGDTRMTALATGRWVEQGRPGRPIAGALISLPLEGWLPGVRAVGNDLAFGFPAGSFGSPSLLIDSVGVRAP